MVIGNGGPMRLFTAASVKSCRKSAEKSDHFSSNNNILIQKEQKLLFQHLLLVITTHKVETGPGKPG